MRPVTIYALCSSRDMRARYVGQTYNLAERTLYHRGRSRFAKTHLGNWVGRVLDDGFKIEVVVLQENAERNVDEIKWIADLHELGAELVNGSPGGDGFGGERGESHRAAISRALRGKPKSQEHRAKLSAALLGRPLDEVRAEKLAQARKLPKKHRGPVGPETGAKISAALSGIKRSDEFKEKLRIAKTGVPRPQIVKDKLSAYWTGRSRPEFIGKKHTPESIAKMKESHRRYHEAKRQGETA